MAARFPFRNDSMLEYAIVVRWGKVQCVTMGLINLCLATYLTPSRSYTGVVTL